MGNQSKSCLFLTSPAFFPVSLQNPTRPIFGWEKLIYLLLSALMILFPMPWETTLPVVLSTWSCWFLDALAPDHIPIIILGLFLFIAKKQWGSDQLWLTFLGVTLEKYYYGVSKKCSHDKMRVYYTLRGDMNFIFKWQNSILQTSTVSKRLFLAQDTSVLLENTRKSSCDG